MGYNLPTSVLKNLERCEIKCRGKEMRKRDAFLCAFFTIHKCLFPPSPKTIPQDSNK